jgi:hypothetical protein
MLKVRQIITKLSEAVSEKDKILIITKIVLHLMKQMAAIVHRPLKVIAINSNSI